MEVDANGRWSDISRNPPAKYVRCEGQRRVYFALDEFLLEAPIDPTGVIEWDQYVETVDDGQVPAHVLAELGLDESDDEGAGIALPAGDEDGRGSHFHKATQMHPPAKRVMNLVRCLFPEVELSTDQAFALSAAATRLSSTDDPMVSSMATVLFQSLYRSAEHGASGEKHFVFTIYVPVRALHAMVPLLEDAARRQALNPVYRGTWGPDMKHLLSGLDVLRNA